MNNMNLQQWFMNCGENAEKVKQYEDNAIKFYEQAYKHNKNKDSVIYNTLSKPLLKEFYIKDKSKLTKPELLASIKGCIIGLIIGLILLFVFPIKQGFNYNSVKKQLVANEYLNTVITYDDTSAFSNFAEGFTDWFKNKDTTKQVKLLFDYNEENPLEIEIEELFDVDITPDMDKTAVFIIMILVIIGCGGFAILCKQIQFSSLTKKLAKQEKEIIPLIEVIPSKYRSYEYMDTLQRIYYKEQSISLTQALDVANEYMMNNRNRNITSILFDVPYKSVINEQIVDNTQYNTPQEQSITEEKPQIKNEFLPSDIETKTFSGSEDAEKDLNKMIGLSSVKDQVLKLKNRIEFYGTADVGNGGNHMVFMGSAGTGKTSVSRIITKIMYDMGYIKENKCVEVSGDYLKSPYTGQTGDRTNAIVEWAMGGVLFIDEAYLLYDDSSASQEATGVLLKAMEDRRKDFIIILAGYEEQMTKLLASNEGFNSRIKYKIYFPDYTVDEMYQIFTHFVNNYNGNNVYLVEDTAKELLCKTFELEKQSKSFGNARTVRNAVEAIMDNYADRCINTGDKSNIIKYEDVVLYAQARENELQHELRNSSASNQVDESIIRLSELKNKVKQGSENPDQDFNNMVGLSTFIDEINILKSQKDFYKDNLQKQNILLIGEEGCGKTTLTSILTGYLYQLGYIKENRYLEISAEFLKGSYVGHTAKRAESIISYASGGVLYIKNIHLLTNTDDSFGQEALSAILTALTSNNNVCIIISDKDGNALYNYQNLFSIVYAFPTYNTEDLLAIFNLNAKKDGFTVSDETYTKLNNHLQTKTFSCRDLIQLYNSTKRNHINNFSRGVVLNKFILMPEDLDTNKPKIKLNLSKKP